MLRLIKGRLLTLNEVQHSSDKKSENKRFVIEDTYEDVAHNIDRSYWFFIYYPHNGMPRQK